MAGQKATWIDLLDMNNERTACLTPHYNPKANRMSVYLTILKPLSDEQITIINEIGFVGPIKTKSPKGLPLMATNAFSVDPISPDVKNTRLNLGPSNRVGNNPDSPSRISLLQQAFPNIKKVEMDYEQEVCNFDFGYDATSNERNVDMPATTQGTEPVQRINDMTLLGLNSQKSRVFESGGSRYVELEDGSVKLATASMDSHLYLRIGAITPENIRKVSQGLIYEAKQTPEFSDSDLDRYVNAIADGAFNTDGKSAIRSMLARELRVNANERLVELDCQDDVSLQALDSYIARLPGLANRPSILPSIAAAARHVFDNHDIDIDKAAVLSPNAEDHATSCALLSMGYKHVVELSDSPVSSPEGIKTSNIDVVMTRLDEDRADIILGVMPSGAFAQRVSRDGFDYTHFQFLAAVNSLSALKEDGYGVITLPAVNSNRDKAFLQHLNTMFKIESTAYFNGPEFLQGETDTLAIVVSGRRLAQDKSLSYDELPSVYYSPDEASSWLSRVGRTIHIYKEELANQERMANANESERESISRLSLSQIASAQSIKDKSRASLSEDEIINPLQANYRALSGDGNYKYYMPISLKRPTMLAQAQLRVELKNEGFENDPIGFLADRLQYDREFLEDEARFSPPQLDSVLMSIMRWEKDGLSFLEASGTGVGKTRIMALNARHSLLNGTRVYIQGDNSAIFNKFMTEMSIIDSAHLVKPYSFVHNTHIHDGSGNVIHKGNNAHINKLCDGVSTIPASDANVFMGTNTMLSRVLKRRKGEPYDDFQRRESETKVALIERIFREDMRSGRPISFIMDESHTSAGNSNTFENASRLLALTGKALFVSGTALPRPHSFSLYRKCFHRDVDFNEMERYLHQSGLPAAEVVASAMAQSTFHCAEIENSKVILKSEPLPHQKEFNTDVNDRHAKFFDMYTSASGEIKKEISRQVDKANQSALNQAIAAGQDTPSPKSPRELGFESEHFGSQAARVSEMMSGALSAIQSVEEIKRAVNDGKRVVASLSRTGQSLLERVREQHQSYARKNNIPYNPDETPVPTLKDSAKLLIDDLVYVTERTGKYIKKRDIRDSMTEQQRSELNSKIDEMKKYVDEHIPSVPVLPIDYMRVALESEGIRVAELSGRSIKVDFNINNVNAPATIIPSKTKREDLLEGYHRGDYDVVILTDAGATSSDLHNKIGTPDSRPVHQVIIETSSRPVNAMQILGRTDRRDQRTKPTFAIIANGIPAQVAQQEQTFLRVAYVMAASKGNAAQNTLKSNRDGDANLLSDVGQRAIIQYLLSNPALSERLDMIEEVRPLLSDREATVEYGNTAKLNIAHRFLARLKLLRCDDATVIINDVSREADRLAEEDRAMGINTAGGARIIPERGSIKRQEVIVQSSHADKQEDPLLGNVTLRVVEVEKTDTPMTSDAIATLIDVGRERLSSAIGFGSDGMASAKSILEDGYNSILVDTLSIAAKNRIAFAGNDSDIIQKEINEGLANKNQGAYVRWTKEKLDWLIDNIELLEPGRIVNARLANDLFSKRGVLVGVTPPRKGQEHNLSQWGVEIAFPGASRKVNASLDALFNSTNDDAPVVELETFDESMDLQEEFDARKSSTSKEVLQILTGNLAKAHQFLNGKGESVLFTDYLGVQRNGILASNQLNLAKVSSVPHAMPSAEVAMLYLKDGLGKHGLCSAREYIPNRHVTITSNDAGQFRFTVPMSQKFGGDLYHQTTKYVRDISGQERVVNPFEHITGTVWHRKGHNMVIDVPVHKLLEVLELIESKLSPHSDEALYGIHTGSGGKNAVKETSDSLAWLNKYNKELSEGRNPLNPNNEDEQPGSSRAISA